VLLILAACDYCILHRDRKISHRRIDNLQENHQISDLSSTVDPVEHDVDLIHDIGIGHLCSLSSSNMSITERNMKEDNNNKNQSNSESSGLSRSVMLPVGLRVESDINVTSDSNKNGAEYEVYTILHAELEAACPNFSTSSFDYSDVSSIFMDGGITPRYNLVSEIGELIVGVSQKKIRNHDSLLHQYRMQSKQKERENNFSVSYSPPTHSVHSGTVNEGSVGLLRGSHNLFDRRISRSTDRSDGSRSTAPVGVLKRTWSALSPLNNLRPLHLSYSDHNMTCNDKGVGKLFGRNKIEICMDFSTGEKPPLLCVEFSLYESLPTVSTSPNCKEVTLFNGLQRLLYSKEKSARTKKSILDRRCELFYSISLVNSNANENQNKDFTPYLKLHNSKEESSNMSWSYTPDENELPLTSSVMNYSTSLDSVDSNIISREEPYSIKSKCGGLDETCIQCLELLSVLAAQSNVVSDPNLKSKVFPGMYVSMALTNKLIEQLEDPLTVVGGALPDWCNTVPLYAPRVFSHLSRRLLLERAAFGMSRATFCQQEAKVAVGPLRQRMAALRGRAVELVGEAFSGGAADPTALQLQADELYGMEEALAARVNAAFRAQKWDERYLQCVKAAIRRRHLLKDASIVMDHYATELNVNRRRLEIRFEGESGFDAASGDEAGVTRGFYADVAEDLLSCNHVCNGLLSFPINLDKSPILSPSSHKLPLWIPDTDISGKIILPSPRVDPNSFPGVYPRPLSVDHPLRNLVLKQFRFIGRLFAAAFRDGFKFPLPLSASFIKLVQVVGQNQNLGRSSTQEELTSMDLPRPGFLGGDIFAAESYICKALEKLNEEALLEDELKFRKQEIATDKNFAKEALGKSYDCSFEEYFEYKRFVDPLDPTQGEYAFALCKNGHSLPVTIENIHEWVLLSKRFFLYDGVIAQALSFRQGVSDFFPADALKLFTAEEIQHDICGCGDNVENWDEGSIRALFKLDGGKGAAEALIAVAAIGGEGGAALSRRFGPSSPTIGFLVKALLEATVIQRRQFLTFVTSVPIVTPGQIEVVPVVNPAGEFLAMSDPGCLPRANTCARRLYLPKFEDYEAFSNVFWAVVREESRFKGFYEWRG